MMWHMPWHHTAAGDEGNTQTVLTFITPVLSEALLHLILPSMQIPKSFIKVGHAMYMFLAMQQWMMQDPIGMPSFINAISDVLNQGGYMDANWRIHGEQL